MSTSMNYLSRRRIVTVGILASMLAAGVLGSVALQSAAVAEGDEDEATVIEATDDSTLGDEEVAPSLSLQDVDTFELTLTRDPFRTVRPEEVVTSASESDGSGDSDGGSSGSTGGSSGGETEPSSACTTNGEVVCDGRVVSVLSTVDGGDSAVIQVDGTSYQVTVGDTFADSFRLLAIDADACARIVYGDEAFTQCPGDTFLK